MTQRGCVMDDKLIGRVKEPGVIPIPNPRFIHVNGDRYITFEEDKLADLAVYGGDLLNSDPD